MLEQVLVVMAVAVLTLVLTTVAVIGVITVRRVRRLSRAVLETYRRVGATIASGRRLDALRASKQGASPMGVSAFAAATRSTVGSPGWWIVQRDRRRFWRTVSAAGHAVKVAQRSNVAVGELPLLAAQLNSAAQGVDSVLRASSQVGSLRPQARRDAHRIEVAAGEIHRAAVDSLRANAQADTDPMLSAIRIEVAALAAGTRAARGAHPPPAG
jgi:hypothetical protein